MNTLLFPHNMQKALHLKDALKKKTSKIAGNYIATIKKDGWYALADFHPELGWSPIYSSSGRAIPAWNHLVERLEKDFNPGFPCRMIWEAIIPDTPFHKLNGIFNRKNEQAEGTILLLHDCIHFGKGIQGFWTPAQMRIQLCKQLKLPSCMEHIPYIGTSARQSDWENWFQSAVDNGEEGIVLMQENSCYASGKRNETLLKLKCEVEADLLCIDLEDSIGKKGEPALNAKLRSRDGTIITVVIPKDSDVTRFKRDPSLIVGNVVKILAMKKLETGAYREPKFHCVREDKTESDID